MYPISFWIKPNNFVSGSQLLNPASMLLFFYFSHFAYLAILFKLPQTFYGSKYIYSTQK